MEFDGDSFIKPVKITFEGVERVKPLWRPQADFLDDRQARSRDSADHQPALHAAWATPVGLV